MNFYEIVDSTGDEIYFPLAVFSDFETAKNELEKRNDKNCQITESGDYDDFEKIEIREREVGWGKRYKILLTLTRNKKYIEQNDEFCWESEYA
jgi:hypothetical protein